jgi:ATP-dependent Clp protease, protease subunit
MEIWHALTGPVERKSVQEAIRTINEDLYSKPVKSLRFLIASGGMGGESDAGINIYTYLKALPIEVETIAFGELDTAATITFLGGKLRTALENCQFIFREGRYTIQDPVAAVHAHEEAIEIFRRELQGLIFIIAKETGNDSEVVAKMLRRGKIMSAEESKEFGITNQIVATLPLYQQNRLGFQPAEGDDQ